jgi:ABC-type Fe2+-enterobactin transport system substrate-binding protein
MNETRPLTNGNTAALKIVCAFLSGLIIAGAAGFISYPRDTITMAQLQAVMPAMISQYSPYTEDQKDIATRLARQDAHMEHIDTVLEQQSRDISRLAQKMNLPASPIP